MCKKKEEEEEREQHEVKKKKTLEKMKGGGWLYLRISASCVGISTPSSPTCAKNNASIASWEPSKFERGSKLFLLMVIGDEAAQLFRR